MPPVPLHAVQTPAKVLLPSFAPRAAPVFFVVLHGFLAHSGAMNSFVVMLRNALDAHNRAVLETNDTTSTLLPFHITTLDARNHGLSPHTPTHELNSLVDDLEHYLSHDLPATASSVCDDLGLDPAALTSSSDSGGPQRTRVVAIGHSMGSMTWTQYIMDRCATPSHAFPSSATATTPLVEVCGLVSMDMPPVTRARRSSSLVAELVGIIESMKKVDMKRVTDLRSAHDEFYRCGMQDIRTRGLCTTNLALTPDPTNPARRVATWKCNVPVLEHSIRSGELFFTDAYLKKPLTACGTAEQREREVTSSPSVGTVPVLSILGGASPIGGADEYRELWERYAVRLEQHSIPGATHTVYYDKPRETIDLVKSFLKHLHML